MRPLGPSTATAVDPPGADPAPTPEVSWPPRLCQPGVTPAVVPANSSYQTAPSAPRTNTTPTPGAGLATPTSPLARPPSDTQSLTTRPSAVLLLLTHTDPPVPMASMYSVPP